eukprot:s5319_g2.t1
MGLQQHHEISKLRLAVGMQWLHVALDALKLGRAGQGLCVAGMEQESNVVKPVQKSASDLMQDTLNSTSKTLVWLQAHYQGIDRPDSSKGKKVEVVEVLREESQTRVRGRITFPPGWISLLDVASGYRWACRVEDRSRVQKPVPALDTSQGGAPTTPRASVMVAPPSSDRIGTVFRKPRAKTMHRRNQPKAD